MTSDKELEALAEAVVRETLNLKPTIGVKHTEIWRGCVAGLRAGMRLQAERSNRIALDFDTRGVPDYQIKLRIAAAIRAAAQGDGK